MKNRRGGKITASPAEREHNEYRTRVNKPPSNRILSSGTEVALRASLKMAQKDLPNDLGFHFMVLFCLAGIVEFLQVHFVTHLLDLLYPVIHVLLFFGQIIGT
jgi:hypothetical protein